MNRRKTILFVIVLVLIGGAAGVLAHAKANQKLGSPGVKTRPLAGSYNLEVLLPPDVPGYQSKALPISELVTNMLPPDTSFGQRAYLADDGFRTVINVVLMGSSRASIHKPQICLTAQGWNISDELSRVDRVHLDRPVPYDLPLMHLIASGQATTSDGQKVPAQAVYLYWFVDADRLTASHAQRMLWSAHDVVTTGVLDRWAYVSLFAMCRPGQEEATFERMKKLIAAAVPDFQLVPNPK